MQNAINKFFKDKKGINDISIIGVILSIFIFSALLIPFINGAVDANADSYDTDNLGEEIQEDAESINTLSLFGVVKTVAKLASWDIGNTLNLPWWLDGIYFILAVIFILVLARNIWIGGGG